MAGSLGGWFWGFVRVLLLLFLGRCPFSSSPLETVFWFLVWSGAVVSRGYGMECDRFYLFVAKKQQRFSLRGRVYARASCFFFKNNRFKTFK